MTEGRGGKGKRESMIKGHEESLGDDLDFDDGFTAIYTW